MTVLKIINLFFFTWVICSAAYHLGEQNTLKKFSTVCVEDIYIKEEMNK